MGRTREEDLRDSSPGGSLTVLTLFTGGALDAALLRLPLSLLSEMRVNPCFQQSQANGIRTRAHS